MVCSDKVQLSLYQSIYFIFKLIVLILKGIRDSRENKRDFRTIYVNNIKPDDFIEHDQPLPHETNFIKTSKVRVIRMNINVI